jgi:malonate transporter and related proteins
MIAAIASALVPIALLIAAGNGLRRVAFVPDAFWPQAERLCYFVLLPALFAHSLGTADLSAVPIMGLASVLIATTILVSIALVLAAPRLSPDGAAFTSVFQGGIRFNNYVGITAAVALYGPPAIALAAVANAAIVPTVNVLCVLVFARFGTARPSLSGILRGIATNPLILGCAAGIALQIAGIRLPAALFGAVGALGQASLPLGLLCVGAALEVSQARSALRPVIVSSLAKFAAMPATAALLCLAFGLDGLAASVAVLFMALPTASSSYVMARQLGGDAPLMATIVAIQTLLALATLPPAILLANALG